MDPINEIAAALAKAQLEMANPAFDSQNPHFKSRFASLAAVRNAVVPTLAKHGIALTQDLKTVDGGVACTTILSHASGQQMVFGPLVMPLTQINPQQVGSASTYAKRYAMQAVAAVVGDEDDDAEAAVAREVGRMSEKQLTDLEALAEDVGADKGKLLKYLKVASLEQLPASSYGSVVKLLEAKRAKNGSHADV